MALAGDNDNAALSRLMLHKAPIHTVFFEVRRANMAAEIGAIHFDRAANVEALDLGSHGFAKLVAEHESRLVLAVEVAGAQSRPVQRDAG